MTENDKWAIADVPADKLNIARYYDYLLGGYHNFEIDRRVGDMVINACPDIRLGALANRAFLRRAVKFLCQQGIDQFLDIGSGIPTSGNVHEVAQRINPSAHIVYVDIDPIAVIHSQAILKDNPNAAIIQEDIHNIEAILKHPSFTGLIDLHRPLGVFMVSVLHFVKDDGQLLEILRILKTRLVPGSYLVVSHYSEEDAPSETVAQINKLSAGAGSPSVSRNFIEVSRLFAGYELVEPGVVRIPLWRPEGPEDVLLEQPERAMGFSGIGRKP